MGGELAKIFRDHVRRGKSWKREKRRERAKISLDTGAKIGKFGPVQLDLIVKKQAHLGSNTGDRSFNSVRFVEEKLFSLRIFLSANRSVRTRTDRSSGGAAAVEKMKATRGMWLTAILCLLICWGAGSAFAAETSFCGAATLKPSISVPTAVAEADASKATDYPNHTGYYPVRVTGDTSAVGSFTIPADWGGAGEAMVGPGCTGLTGMSGQMADIWPVSVSNPGTYSFHLTSDYCVGTNCTPQKWDTFMFLTDSCDQPANYTRICNHTGYGAWTGSVSGLHRSDMTVNLPLAGTYYLVVTTLTSGAKGPYALWVLNDAYGFGDYNGTGSITPLDSLESLFVAIDRMYGGACSTSGTGCNKDSDCPSGQTCTGGDLLCYPGFFDIDPPETLLAATYDNYHVQSNSAYIFPVGDGVVGSYDSLNMLYLSLGLEAIPQGQAECMSTCSTSQCCNASAGSCASNTPDNKICGSNNAACVNCGALGLYCYHNACEKCDANTCPNGCCDFSAATGSESGVCQPGFTDLLCGTGGAQCQTCGWGVSAPAGSQPTYNKGTECWNQTCQNITVCNVTIDVASAPPFCLANLTVNYPSTGYVHYEAIERGYLDAAFSEIGAKNSTTAHTVTLTAEGGTPAQGTGSIAVLQFLVDSGATVDKSAFTINSATESFLACAYPYGSVNVNNVSAAVDCSPGTFTATQNCNLTLSLVPYDEICTAAMQVPFPAGVSYTGIAVGSIDPAFTVATNPDTSYVAFTAYSNSNPPVGVWGPGSFAVLQFTVPPGYSATQTDFLPTLSSVQFDSCYQAGPPVVQPGLYNPSPAYGVGLNCTAVTPCSASNPCTTGCCDGDGNCQPGTGNSLCGTGGGSCVDCTQSVPPEICVSQACAVD